MKKCMDCGAEIPPERLSLMPTDYCVKCVDSHTTKPLALMDYAHKTAGTVVLINASDPEQVRRAYAVYRRKR